MNGFVCLRIKRIVGLEKASPERAEFRVTVELARRDGSVYAHPTDGRTRLVFRVGWANGPWRVLDLPVLEV